MPLVTWVKDKLQSTFSWVGKGVGSFSYEYQQRSYRQRLRSLSHEIFDKYEGLLTYVKVSFLRGLKPDDVKFLKGQLAEIAVMYSQYQSILLLYHPNTFFSTMSRGRLEKKTTRVEIVGKRSRQFWIYLSSEKDMNHLETMNEIIAFIGSENSIGDF